MSFDDLLQRIRSVNDGPKPSRLHLALAFGAQVDWYRNLVAAGGGTIQWRGHVYSVTAPERVDAATVLTSFDPVQRLPLRIAGIDGFVQVRDAESFHT